MKNKDCCRTCGHGVSSQGTSFTWCRLRKLRIHSDISSLAFCHHWTRSEPRLPVIANNDDKQLDFGRAF